MSRRRKTHQLINIDRFNEVCEDIRTSNVGYGYKDMARLCDIGSSSMYIVIYQKGDFSAEKLKTIALKTGVSIDWLLGLSDRKYINE